MLAVDAVNKSNSGHPGLPMGCAPMGYALWQNILNHNPNNPCLLYTSDAADDA